MKLKFNTTYNLTREGFGHDMIQRLKTKDLINIGIFSGIYFIVMFCNICFGHNGNGSYIVFALSVFVIILIAEIIFRAGKFKSFKFNALANAVFSCWICGPFLQMIFVKKQYMEMTVKSMGQEFAKTLESLITLPTLILVYLGAYLGKAMLKKHFEKVGIV